MIFTIDIRDGEARVAERLDRELVALQCEERENDDDYQPVTHFGPPVLARLVA